MKKCLISKRIFSIFIIIIVWSCEDNNEDYIKEILFEADSLSAYDDEDCEDISGWLDAWGDGCSYYEVWGCDNANEYASDGVNAYDACCFCGGG